MSRDHKAFIDRIEGEWAVLLVDDEEVEVPLSSLPAGAGEGQWLDGDLDPELTARIAKKNADLRDKLAADDDGGDFSL